MNFDDQVLLSAWANVPMPPRSAITTHRCDECDEIRDFFADRPWTSLNDVASLRDHYDALTFFSPSAFHYYLPAFIRATLIDPEAAGLIADVIVSIIRLEFGVASRGKLALFSPPQRHMLAQFLRALPRLDPHSREEVETMADLLAR